MRVTAVSRPGRGGRGQRAARRVLRTAGREAARAGGPTSTGHLLIALLRDGEGAGDLAAAARRARGGCPSAAPSRREPDRIGMMTRKLSSVLIGRKQALDG
jgi:hypothetical protein